MTAVFKLNTGYKSYLPKIRIVLGKVGMMMHCIACMHACMAAFFLPVELMYSIAWLGTSEQFSNFMGIRGERARE